jgi:hypothetical protein
MMADIKVLTNRQDVIDFDSLSPVDIELFFRDLDNVFSRSIQDDLIDMYQNGDIRRFVKFSNLNPDITESIELLLREAIKVKLPQMQTIGGRGLTVIPIIEIEYKGNAESSTENDSLPESDFTPTSETPSPESVSDDEFDMAPMDDHIPEIMIDLTGGADDDAADGVDGGASKRFRPGPVSQSGPSRSNEYRRFNVNIRERENVEKFVVNFDETILCLRGRREYFTAPSEDITIIGLIITPACTTVNIGTEAEPRYLRSMIKPTCGINDIVRGAFSPSGVDATCDAELPQRITIGDEIFTKSFPFIFSQMDAPRIRRLLTTIIKYNHIIMYNRIVNPGSRIYVQIEKAMMSADVDKPSKSSSPSPLLAKIIKMYKEHYKQPLITFNTYAAADNLPGDIASARGRGEFIKRLRDIFGGGFAVITRATFVAELIDRHFFNAFMVVEKNGFDDKFVTERFKQQEHQFAGKQFVLSEIKRTTDARAKLNAFMRIVSMRMGNRVGYIDKTNATALLGSLTPKEREIVQTEYDKELKYREAYINNKCKHVPIYRRLRAIDSRRVRQDSLAELEKYYSAKTQTSMIQCNVCGFDIVCPHYIKLLELEFANAPFKTIKYELTKYFDPKSTRDDYYCKICGEIIYSQFDTADDAVAGSMNDELQRFIWQEIVQMIGLIKFPNLVDKTAVIASLRDSIYEYIADVEKEILKSRTNTIGEIKAKKSLYTAIYVGARLVQLVNDTKASFVPPRSGPAPASVAEMIKYILGVIITMKNVTIKEIPNMSTEIIKSRLISTYKTLTNDIKTTELNMLDLGAIAGATFDNLMVDSTFRYVYNMLLLVRMRDAKGRLYPTSDDMALQAENVLGAPFKTVMIMKNMYEKLNTKPIHKLGGGFSVDVFMAYMKYVTSDEYTVPAFATTDIVNITYNPTKWAKDALELKRQEQKNNQTPVHRVYAGWKRGEGGQQFVEVKTPLGCIWDENGVLHKWSIYVTRPGDKAATANYTKDEMISKAIPWTHTIDRKCAICGVLKSKSCQLNEDKINEALGARAKIGNFYAFYEIRCPVGGVHDFADSPTVCSKCNLNIDWFDDPYNADSLMYYREYYPKYNSERASMRTVANIAPLQPPPMAAKYQFVDDFSAITRLSERLNINYRLFTTLGGYEGEEYTQVLSGKFTPPIVTSRNDIRIFTLKGYVTSLLIQYNQLRNYVKLNKPSADLVAIIDTDPSVNIATLADTLPDIADGFLDAFQYMYENEPPERIVTFCIQAICSKCLTILDGKGVNKIRTAFVTRFITYMLKREELMTKYGQFSWSIIYGTRDETMDVEKALKIKDTTDEDEGESQNVFSNDGFDTENNAPDAIDDDGEHEDIGLHIGDEYGLD